MVNYQLTINGIVQGVGFRWGCMSIARQLKVTGFVRNLPSGQVYIEVQGSKDQVQQFIEQVKAGPTPYARVVAKVTSIISNLIGAHSIRPGR